MTQISKTLLTIDDVLTYSTTSSDEKKRLDKMIHDMVGLLDFLKISAPEHTFFSFKVNSALDRILPASIKLECQTGYVFSDDYSFKALQDDGWVSATTPDRSIKEISLNAYYKADDVAGACCAIIAQLSKRLALGNIYMDTAKRYASLSTCNRRKVGAILVKKGRVISTGTNGSPEGEPHCVDEGCLIDSKGHCQRTVHAEQNAILFCADQGIPMHGTAMYCTDFPCTKCLQSMMQTNISAVYYERDYTDEFNKKIAANAMNKMEFFNYNKGLFTKIKSFEKPA